MKVQSVAMRNFKRFADKRVSFVDDETGAAKDLIVLVGNNGSGKSTVLQAIAATLGTATRRLASVENLEWPGFDLSLVGNSWNLPPRVDLDMEFPEDERNAIREYFEKVPGLADRPGFTLPSDDATAKLRLAQGGVEASCPAQKFQFFGRNYAKQIVKLVKEGHDVFRRVGTVFWYTEHRTATSLTAEATADSTLDEANGQAMRYDENRLRRRLADLMQFHERIERQAYELRPGQRDLFADLERAYKAVFPGRSFQGAVPRSEIDDVLREPWFFLFDGHHQYEIAEMSGGERAIFPMLFDFANWNIHNSVILIDEIELHLHPPMQQALIRALGKLGENNQFIITTHSDSIEQIVPASAIVRLED